MWAVIRCYKAYDCCKVRSVTEGIDGQGKLAEEGGLCLWCGGWEGKGRKLEVLGFRACGGLNPVFSKGMRYSGMTDTWPEDRRWERGLGPMTMGRRLMRHCWLAVGSCRKHRVREWYGKSWPWQGIHGKQGAPRPQRDMPKPHWPEDPPFNVPLTGKALASVYLLPASGSQTTHPLLPCSPPLRLPFLSSPSLPALSYTPFFVAKGSLVLDHSEGNHYPPM